MTANTTELSQRIAELPELPQPLEIIWLELNPHALGCGVEDRGIHDRYEAAEYGWQDGVNKAAECVPDDIYDTDTMRSYALAAQAPLIERIKELEKDAARWKQMAEFQYAMRAYPNDLELVQGALDAYMRGWSYDAALASSQQNGGV